MKCYRALSDCGDYAVDYTIWVSRTFRSAVPNLECLSTFSWLVKPAIPFEVHGRNGCACEKAALFVFNEGVHHLQYAHTLYDENCLFRRFLSSLKVLPVSSDSPLFFLKKMWHDFKKSPSPYTQHTLELSCLSNKISYFAISWFPFQISNHLSTLVSNSIPHK